MRALYRCLPIAVLLVSGPRLLAAGQAFETKTVHLKGQLGFIGEWAFEASLQPQEGRPDFAGPLIVRHVGLCGIKGPETLEGRATAVALGTNTISGLHLAYGRETCTFSGPFSRAKAAFMRCGPGNDIPIRAWVMP